MRKIALVFICLNPQYWPYLKDVVEDARKNFLPGNKVDFFVWSDIPSKEEKEKYLATRPPDAQLLAESKSALCEFVNAEQTFDPKKIYDASMNVVAQVVRAPSRENCERSIDYLNSQEDITIIPTEPVQWPYPTLMRYHLFLQKEKELSEYDYVFYLDADMRIVDTVGEEILGEGLTMAEHPMYAVRREYIPPYEPNQKSAAYVPRFGILTEEGGKHRFKTLYAAGGFQGGKSGAFIEAMKEMKKTVDQDFNNNYIAIWNDESHWNKYLSHCKYPITVLSPAYVYPDSLIEEYYKKVWGCDYPRKIITLTKPFTTSTKEGAFVNEQLKTI